MSPVCVLKEKCRGSYFFRLDAPPGLGKKPAAGEIKTIAPQAKNFSGHASFLTKTALKLYFL